MFCERCGSALPSNSFTCTHCGAMMTKTQIEMQKKMNKENRNIHKPEYMSAKFGSKREFIRNEKVDNTYLKMILIMSFIIIVVLIIMLLSI